MLRLRSAGVADDYDSGHASGVLPVEGRAPDWMFEKFVPSEIDGTALIWVAGSNAFHRDAIQSPMFDPGRAVVFVPEPENPHDRNAIAIYEPWLNLKCGYVPRKLTSKIGPQLKDGRIVRAMVAWQWIDDSGERIGLHVLVTGESDVRIEEDADGGLQFSGPPTFPGPIHGLRAWKIELGRGGATINALAGFCSWEWTTEWQASRCEAGGRRRHASPAPNCHCGFNAWHPWKVKFADFNGDAAGSGVVWGAIEAAGKVELHGDGFRCEQARIIALYLSDQNTVGEARALETQAAAAGIPLIHIGSRKQLADEMEKLSQFDRDQAKRLVREARQEVTQGPTIRLGQAFPVLATKASQAAPPAPVPAAAAAAPVSLPSPPTPRPPRRARFSPHLSRRKRFLRSLTGTYRSAVEAVRLDEWHDTWKPWVVVRAVFLAVYGVVAFALASYVALSIAVMGLLVALMAIAIPVMILVEMFSG